MANREAATITKVSLIGISGSILSFLIFYFFNNFLTTFDFGLLWFVLAASLLFLIVYALQAFFVRDSLILFFLSLLQGLVPFIAFYPYAQVTNFWSFVGAGLLIFTASLIIGSKQGFDDIENSVRIKFFSISDSVVPKAFIGLLLLMLIFSYFYLFHLGNFSDDDGEILFNKSLESVEPALKIWFPGVTFDMSVEAVLDKMTSVQMNRSKIDLLQEGVNFDELPEVAQQKMLNDVRAKITSTLENLTGKVVQPDQKLNTYLYQSFSQWLGSFSDSLKLFFEIGAFILIFFTIKGISFVISIPVKAISFLLFKFLTLIGFADIGIKTVSKEQIII